MLSQTWNIHSLRTEKQSMQQEQKNCKMPQSLKIPLIYGIHHTRDVWPHCNSISFSKEIWYNTEQLKLNASEWNGIVISWKYAGKTPVSKITSIISADI